MSQYHDNLPWIPSAPIIHAMSTPPFIWYKVPLVAPVSRKSMDNKAAQMIPPKAGRDREIVLGRCENKLFLMQCSGVMPFFGTNKFLREEEKKMREVL